MTRLAPWNRQVVVVWMTQADEKVRSGHRPLHEVEATAGPYGRMPEWEMEGRVAHYPGDPRLPPHLRVNCRCWVEVGEQVGDEVVIGRPAVQVEVVEGELVRTPVPDSRLLDLMESGARLMPHEQRAALEAMGFPWEAIQDMVGAAGLGDVQLAHVVVSGRLDFFLTILDDVGRQVATLERSIRLRNGELWVHNNVFRVASDFRGQGLGTAVLQHLDDWYRSVGVRGTQLHAGMDVGGYAWAKAGYDWNPDRMSSNEVRGLVDRIARYVDGDADRADLAGVRERIGRIEEAIPYRGTLHEDERQAEILAHPDFPLPVELAMIGWREGRTSWAGKLGMLGSDWEGRRFL